MQKKAIVTGGLGFIGSNLIKLLLKNNFFEQGSDIFKQVKGTAIGTKFAPQYAIVYLGEFEDTALEGYGLKPWVWWRYIDDIFTIWEHGEEEFLKFMEYLNSLDPNIKFTFKYSRECIEFLDVLVKRDGDALSTDLYCKETDAHQFLHFDSCHPYHTKKGILLAKLFEFDGFVRIMTALKRG